MSKPDPARMVALLEMFATGRHTDGHGRKAALEAIGGGPVRTYEERARWLADEAQVLLQDHERREHDGERCYDETLNLLAFLAHSIGISEFRDDEEAVRWFAKRVRDYSANHEEHQH